MNFTDYLYKTITNFNYISAIEIVFIFVVIYFSYSFYKKNNSTWFCFAEIIAILLVFLFNTLGFVGGKIYIFALLMLLCLFPLILFSGEIKRGLFRLSWKRKFNVLSAQELSQEELQQSVNNIVKACLNMSKANIGALIIIADNINQSIVESGTSLNAEISSQLIETLFFPRSPLHDGAVLIVGDKLISAGCYLTLTSRTDLSKDLGTRHRAGIGHTEQFPQNTAIIVSEETGIISASHDGRLIRYLDGESLVKVVKHALNISGGSEQEQLIWGAKYEE
ncbi:MAG: diadenylate cyclase [Clostridia bacterium]